MNIGVLQRYVLVFWRYILTMTLNHGTCDGIYRS